MATSNSTAPTYNQSVKYKHSSSNVFPKAFMLFNLPNLSGGTATAATLTLRSQTAGGTGTLSGLTIKSSNTNISWDESTAYGTMDGYSLSAALATGQNISLPTSPTNYTWNVWGDASSGIQQAYALGNGKTTLVLVNTTYTSAATGAGGAVIENGDENVDTWVQFYSRSDATYYPYLTITYTPSASRRPFTSCSIGGVYY